MKVVMLVPSEAACSSVGATEGDKDAFPKFTRSTKAISHSDWLLEN